MRIGVFDSGIGGAAVAAKIRLAFKHADVLTVDDSKNVPYGLKTPPKIIQLTDDAIQPLIVAKCNPIVIACNTASAVAIETLRHKYPHIQFIGLEPMLKSAAKLTRTGVVAMYATPATLQSERYRRLKMLFARDLTVLEPDCSSWAGMIEHSAVDENVITDTVSESIHSRADVIVLGCTHYHWVGELIAGLADGYHVLEPSAAVIRRITQLTDVPSAKQFTDCINCSATVS